MKQMPYRMDEGALERAKMRSRAAVYAASQRSKIMRSVRWASAIAAAACIALIVFVGYKAKPELTPMECLIAEMHEAPLEIIYDMTLDSSLYVEEGDSLSDIF